MAARDHLDAAVPDGRRPLAPPSPWLRPEALGVLVADEDPGAPARLTEVLGPGVAVTVCADGAEALWQAGRAEPVVVILSATLPLVSAEDVATVLMRHRAGPGSVLVSLGAGEADRAAPVLAAGANGVLSRPYRADEIELVLRAHRSALEQRSVASSVLVAGPLTLDGPAFEARAAGRPLRLTLREFEILRLLMLHVGDVVPSDQIRRQIWESRGETVSSNTIAVHIRHLRKHLTGVAGIVSVRRVGYRLTVMDHDVEPVGELSA